MYWSNLKSESNNLPFGQLATSKKVKESIKMCIIHYLMSMNERHFPQVLQLKMKWCIAYMNEDEEQHNFFYPLQPPVTCGLVWMIWIYQVCSPGLTNIWRLSPTGLRENPTTTMGSARTVWRCYIRWEEWPIISHIHKVYCLFYMTDPELKWSEWW